MTERTTDAGRWDTLERWSPTAFLVAGGLWLVDTVLLGLELTAGISLLGTPGTVNPLLYLSGLVAAMAGLLGLYPELAGRTPRLARAGAGLVAIAGIVIPVLLAWLVTATLLNRPDPPFVLLLLSLLVVVLGTVLFGIASVRTGVPSRAVGLLVLAIPATLFVLVLGIAVTGGDAPGWASPAVGAVTSILLLAIGRRLRAAAAPARGKTAAAREAHQD